MWFPIVALLFIYSCAASSSGPTTRCSGTRYGCCPDGMTPSKGLNYYGCPEGHLATSPECRAFLASLPVPCAAMTTCLDLQCNCSIVGNPTPIDLDIHSCSDTPSVSMTMTIPVAGYQWSHKFVRNTTITAPRLEIDFGVHSFLRFGSVSVFFSVYTWNKDIYMTFGLQTYAWSEADFSGFSLNFGRCDIMEKVKLPVDRRCVSSRKCSSDCEDCLDGDDGWVCYTCPSACPSPFSHPVCGSDMMSYSSECNMRAAACKTNKALRVLYPGHCVSDPPTKWSLLAPWPTSNITSNVQSLLQRSLAFLVVVVSRDSVSTYNTTYFDEKLDLVLGYQVTVIEIRNVLHRSGNADEQTLNLTMFAHYHSSVGRNEVIVPSTELAHAIEKNKAKLEETMKAVIISASSSDLAITTGSDTSSTPLIVSSSSMLRQSDATGSDSSFSETGVGRFYTLQPLTITGGDHSSVTAIIAATVSVLGVLIVVVGSIAVYLCHRISKASDSEVTEMNASYRSGSDEVTVVSSGVGDPDLSEGAA